eukprot:TRINITY_DN10318_c0_g1_i1.p1 TRINITY_DN10318_c0_g1~~TRINITY_DN10318_c0_g1_i1.p1  ORF type:complete len:500 (-),score=103.34 TRINITY_DN10318_c0_g1_i1:305-1729(-)
MAQYSDSEVAHFLEVEGGLRRQACTGSYQRGGFGVRHIVAAVAGAAAVATCGTLAYQHSAPESQKLTARMLFESPAVHNVATENVMNIKTHAARSSKSRDEVHGLVQKTFRGIVGNMKERTPEMWQALESTELTQEQHDDVVRMMRLLKDPRVMKLGLDTAKAIQEAGSDDEETLKSHIVKKLKPHAWDIQEIYMKAMPHQSFATSQPGDGFKSILSPERRRILKTVRGDGYQKFTGLSEVETVERKLVWGPQTSPGLQQAQPVNQNSFLMTSYSTPSAMPQHSWVQQVPHPYQVAEEVMGIIGTAIAEADVLIRMINPLEKVMPGGHDLKIPPMVTSGLGGADFAVQTADCEMDAVADHMNPMEMFGCPMMSASAGFDMLREPLTLLGLLGDNKDNNGHQGNHAGHHAHQGIFDDTAEGQAMKQKEKGVFPFCMFWGMHTCQTGKGATQLAPSGSASTSTPPPPPPTTTQTKK